VVYTIVVMGGALGRSQKVQSLRRVGALLQWRQLCPLTMACSITQVGTTTAGTGTAQSLRGVMAPWAALVVFGADTPEPYAVVPSSQPVRLQ
jgi:hypothetical protein